MKSWLLVGAVCAMTACGGEAVELEVSWTLTGGSDGEDPIPPCPLDGVLVIKGVAVAPLEVPCTDTGALTLQVEPGLYVAAIDVIAGDEIIAVSDIQQVEVGDGGAELAFAFPTLWGFVTFTWAVVDDTGAAITCDEINAFEVLVVAEEAQGTIGWEIACDDGGLGPLEVAVGDYTMCAVLRDIDGNVIGNPFDVSRVIDFGNQTDYLGELVFQVPPDEPGPAGLCGQFGP